MVRISAKTYIRIMRDAVAQRVAETSTAQDSLLLNGLNELVRRSERGTAPIEAMRDDVRRLLGKLAEARPDLATEHAEEAAALSTDDLRGQDPADYFDRALALFEKIVDALGKPGLLPKEHLSLAGEFATWEEKVTRGDGSRATPPAPREEQGGLSAETVHAFLKEQLPDEPDIEVVKFDEILGGMSKRAFRMTIASSKRGSEEMIVKKADGPPPAPLDCMIIPREFDMLKAARSAGLLAPEPMWLGCGIPEAQGDFYVMRKSRGSSNTSLLSTASPIPESVLLGIAEQMARLHTTPLSSVSQFLGQGAPDALTIRADEAVAQRLEAWRQVWLGFERRPSPIESYLFSWLKANVPANDSLASIIHGDLTPHNCLWEGDELTAVLDWECAHFGDPAEDMTYAKPLIEQRMDWAKFVKHYRDHGGPDIPERSMVYHSCYLNLRSVVLSNLYVTHTDGNDLRPLMVDTQFYGLFLDTCMSAIRTFEAMR